MNKDLILVECPRDAMQGWMRFIPSAVKAMYLQKLLSIGFHTLDFGSFVSPKAIPQMSDTADVLHRLDMSATSTKLLAIVANVRGAEEAAAFKQVSYIGFPFSVSETFQQRNTNSSIANSFVTVKTMRDICIKHKKTLVVYLSMGFGNPYGDDYSSALVTDWAGKMAEEGIKIISIADTVGLAEPEDIYEVMHEVISAHPDISIGVHLHSTPMNRAVKLDAALKAGCRRFDSAIKGIGGCPMAGDDLVGNMDTEFMVQHFRSQGIKLKLNDLALTEASMMATSVFV